jgi:hypothetical protein
LRRSLIAIRPHLLSLPSEKDIPAAATMIVESSAQSSLSYSDLLEKDKVAPMVNKAAPMDNPPAYSDLGSEIGHSGSASRGPSRGRRGHRGHPGHNQQCGHNPQAFANSPPSPTVDQVHIYDRKHNIEGMDTSLLECIIKVTTLSGTFYIDPMVPTLDPSRRHKSKSDETLPHASFRTHHNTIDLNIGTTGDVHKAAKVNVNVASRDGFIKVTMVCNTFLVIFIL